MNRKPRSEWTLLKHSMLSQSFAASNAYSARSVPRKGDAFGFFRKLIQLSSTRLTREAACHILKVKPQIPAREVPNEK
jgi:hypothetical protein